MIYDQRQSGKYNIRINIKDVAIIEMDNNGFGEEDSSEEDYYYDEDDLTVKPLKLTTPFPTFLQPLISTPIQATSKPTVSPELSQPRPTPMATTTVQPMHNINILSSTQTSEGAEEITIQETTNMYANPLSSHKPTQILLEPRSEYMPAPKFMPAGEMKLNSKIMSPATASPTLIAILSSPPGLVHHEKQKIQRSEDKTGITVFPTKLLHYNESGVFKFRMQQNKKPTKHHFRQCRTNQYLDLTGNCRNKRSASFLKKLFNIISNFPFILEKDARHE
ncbi:uncharacterized protein LOC128862695 [Anastrepha ludens]|uniref:uncharacterized protein LOC128862695 n=1 Tax=Anastrepha ludens TaxID=28586 RepID=UPI0023B1C18F|nr:uncharacterized protein LOC128862695 [Anastrepha ludens]